MRVTLKRKDDRENMSSYVEHKGVLSIDISEENIYLADDENKSYSYDPEYWLLKKVN